jgi:hypothetical protein
MAADHFSVTECRSELPAKKSEREVCISSQWSEDERIVEPKRFDLQLSSHRAFNICISREGNELRKG